MCNKLGKMCGAGDQTGYFQANHQFSAVLLTAVWHPVSCDLQCRLLSAHVCYVNVCM